MHRELGVLATGPPGSSKTEDVLLVWISEVTEEEFQKLRKSGTVCVFNCSVVSDSATSWTGASQAPLYVEFSRPKSGLAFPSPGSLPDPGIEPRVPPPELQEDSLLSELPGKPQEWRWRNTRECKGLLGIRFKRMGGKLESLGFFKGRVVSKQRVVPRPWVFQVGRGAHRVLELPGPLWLELREVLCAALGPLHLVYVGRACRGLVWPKLGGPGVFTWLDDGFESCVWGPHKGLKSNFLTLHLP